MLNLIKHASSRYSQFPRAVFQAEKNPWTPCCQGPSSHFRATLFCHPTTTPQSSMHSCPLPLSLKGIKVGQAATEPALAPTGDGNLSGNSSLLLVGVMMEGEGDGSVPGSLQHRVLQAALVRAVLPLRQVRRAVGASGRGPHLVPVHTAATLDPATRSVTHQHKAPLPPLPMGCLKLQPSYIWINSPGAGFSVSELLLHFI